jgi:hypothetical protein
MIGNSVIERWSGQNGNVVSVGKETVTKPNPPISFAPRAQDLVRVGRVFHMQEHLVFGLVSGLGRDW